LGGIVRLETPQPHLQPPCPWLKEQQQEPKEDFTNKASLHHSLSHTRKQVNCSTLPSLASILDRPCTAATTRSIGDEIICTLLRARFDIDIRYATPHILRASLSYFETALPTFLTPSTCRSSYRKVSNDGSLLAMLLRSYQIHPNLHFGSLRAPKEPSLSMGETPSSV